MSGSGSILDQYWDKAAKDPLNKARVVRLEFLIRQTKSALDYFPPEPEVEISDLSHARFVTRVPILNSLVALHESLLANRGSIDDHIEFARALLNLAGYIEEPRNAAPLYRDVIKVLDWDAIQETENPKVFSTLAQAHYHLGLFTVAVPLKRKHFSLAYDNAFSVVEDVPRLSMCESHYFGRIYVEYASLCPEKSADFREFLYERGIELLHKAKKRNNNVNNYRELGFAYFELSQFTINSHKSFRAARMAQRNLTEAINKGDHDPEIIDVLTKIAANIDVYKS